MSIYYEDPRFLKKDESVRYGFFGSQGGTSRGLYSSLNCGLSTDDNPQNVRENKARALGSLGLDNARLVTLYQIHSDQCHVITPDLLQDIPAKGDSLATDQPGYALGVLSADCAPVLFYGEKETGEPVIGAAHAGWKGALDGVLENTVRTMVGLGAAPDKLRAIVGPAIGPQSYEVGAEFQETFLRQNDQYHPCFTNAGSKIFFDLPAFCEMRLQVAGVGQIFHKNLDTFFHEDDFFSFRRATHRKDRDYGRQISIISIK
ncbi:MAG: peptidoglycan editing factor PgeF [Rhodospirillales bacterium]|nr:peptidoglycan editing factor PgeF [Rhodospirillales bacterium]MCB9973568.1 peptidoglycan editing factor PgeF [Rhodospirillales bacterium]MCB9979628.1 peptidoglycan editing factor PgeF [Rhodospirillales bacterium]